MFNLFFYQFDRDDEKFNIETQDPYFLIIIVIMAFIPKGIYLIKKTLTSFFIQKFCQ